MVRLGSGFFAVLVISFVVHEAAHARTGVALGQAMAVGLNHAVPLGGALTEGQAALVSIAGPIVTILIALVAFALARRSTAAMLFVLAAFVSRLLATIVSLFHPNDEMRVSLYLGLGPWLLPLLVTAGLGALAVLALRGHPIGWRGGLGLYLGGSLALGLILGLDRVLPPIVLG